MSRFLLITVLSGLCFAAYADKKLSVSDFLYNVRHPAGRKRWAVMDGEVIHRRRGKENVHASLYLGFLFNHDRTLAQVIINKEQGYQIGQAFMKGKDGTTLIYMNKATKEKPIIGNFGLRPEDLTMSFLYWKFIREFPEESSKMIDCRVMELESPDKTETAKVWISKKYYFPIKVEWTKAGEKEPFRSLEVSSFKQQGDYGVIKRLDLYGDGWRTRINFTRTEVGTPENGVVPKGLFLQLKKGK